MALEKELEKERIITDSLMKQKNTNQKRLDTLSQTFDKYKSELDEMHSEHNNKIDELHHVRQKANEEIKHLSTEVNKIQSEINILVMETRKYES